MDFDKQWGTHIDKNVIFIFILQWWYLCGTEEQSERVCTHKRAIGSWNNQWELGHTSTPTQCLFFIGHGLHPCNAYFSLAMVYTHAILIFHWLWFTPMLCLFSNGHGLYPHIAYFLVVTFLILSTAGWNS